MCPHRPLEAEPPITPELLLHAYRMGIFPMSESREDMEIFWVDPQRRGVLPLDGFHISRSLRKRILSQRFTVSVDQAFGAVLDGCADRDETWINPAISALYIALHTQGHAHSLEVWDGEELAGGVYGVTIGGAFFGESMFSRRTDASKVALAYLVQHLCRSGFQLFDTQFLTSHLKSLGAEEISRHAYHKKLHEAVAIKAEFLKTGALPSAQEVVMQRKSQTS